MGLRSVILGHCHPAVLRAVRRQLALGANFTRPSPVEIDLAARLAALIPSAEMVKFAKNGSDVTSAAIRLARAYTGRDIVAYCRDHPFYSFDDWFIGTTPCNAGVPRAFTALSKGFRYNHLEDLADLFTAHPDGIAAVIMEPVTSTPPVPGFLAGVRDLTAKNGAVLIFDEMITGFRWSLQGGQGYFGVIPDLSTFGKALGNGFSVAALAGKRALMELGGLEHARERVFLLSSTHGGETHSLAAALATIGEMESRQVISRIWAAGRRLAEGFTRIVSAQGIQDYLYLDGYPCSPVVVCKDRSGRPSPALRTVFLQELVKHGILMPCVSVSYAHGERELASTLDGLEQAAGIYGRALADGPDRWLEGPVVKPVFRKFN